MPNLGSGADYGHEYVPEPQPENDGVRNDMADYEPLELDEDGKLAEYVVDNAPDWDISLEALAAQISANAPYVLTATDLCLLKDQEIITAAQARIYLRSKGVEFD